MKVRAITIENFRKFRLPVTLSGFGDGLNLICEPNEFGKSTILAAMRAALFERHGSKSEAIRRFKPHGESGSPRIDLTFEIAGRTWRVQKSFLTSPRATLESDGELYRGDEAEEKLQALLGAGATGNRGSTDDSRGVLGLLWVEQGGSAALAAPGDVARRTLHSVLEGEVGFVTGGQRTSAVLKSIDASLGKLLTPGGKPTGVLQAAETAAVETAAMATSAEAEALKFEQVLDELSRTRKLLVQVSQDLADPEDESALATIAEQATRAQTAAGDAREKTLLSERATGRREGAAAKAAERKARRAALADAVRALADCESLAGEQGDALAAARIAEAAARDDMTGARASLVRAEADHDAAVKASLAAGETRALQTAFVTLDKALALAATIESLDASISSNLMTPEQLKIFAGLADAALKARSALEAASPVLQIELLDHACDIRLDGEPVRGSIKRTVATPATIDIAGIGHIRLTPAAGGEAGVAKLRRAESALQAFLEKVRHPDEDSARIAAERRRDLAAEVRDRRAELERLCPGEAALGIGQGLPALRAALAGRDRPEVGTTDAVSIAGALKSTDRTVSDARAAERKAGGSLEAAITSLGKADSAAAAARTLRDTARADRERLAAELARDETKTSDATLEQELLEASRQEAGALLQQQEAQRFADALNLVELDARKRRIETKRKRLTEERVTLSGAIGSLEANARTLGQDGPFQRAKASQEAAALAKATADRLRHEANVLSLLRTTILDAQRDAQQRFLLPITRRVEPYIQRLLPATTITFDAELKPSAISRSGQSENADTLSIGTQEQIAILTRIAFAELLIDKGKPASLLLDDALVFADDERFDTMTEILAEAGERMQVIVLSCRRRAFLGVDAQLVRMAS